MKNIQKTDHKTKIVYHCNDCGWDLDPIFGDVFFEHVAEGEQVTIDTLDKEGRATCLYCLGHNISKRIEEVE